MTSTSAAFPPEKTEEQKAQEAAAESEAHDAEVRSEAIWEAGDLVKTVIADTLHRFGSGEVQSLREVIDFMEVELGFLDPRGPHHRSPGMEAILKGDD